MVLRPIAVMLLALLGSACASRGPAAVTRIEAPQRCDARWKLDAAPVLEIDALQPASRRFDARSPCLVEARGQPAVSYAAYRLPHHRGDWTLDIDSRIDGHSLFAPEALTLDQRGRVLRRLPYERFTLRGDHLRATLFFGQQDAAERYLVLRSAPQAVGRDQQRVVSGAFFVPILTGLIPLVYMQGTESERRYTLSHSGRVELRAQSGAEGAAPRRRPVHGTQAMRAELDPFAR